MLPQPSYMTSIITDNVTNVDSVLSTICLSDDLQNLLGQNGLAENGATYRDTGLVPLSRVNALTVTGISQMNGLEVPQTFRNEIGTFAKGVYKPYAPW